MEIYEKLTKQIDETKYLSTENSYRYRPIMRCFYNHYERLEYWLYKEDVYNELKTNILFKDYTLEECERDIEVLTEWMSLERVQDTKNATSLEEFKNKKYRYKLTDYAVEIERLTISLEEMEIKTSSLEPKLFDSIRINLSKLKDVNDLSDESINQIFTSLNEDFTKLNQNYQDFLGKFNEPKNEELLQVANFLTFKTDIIKYLREFIKGYQNNVYQIKNIISGINDYDIENILNKLNSHYKKIPMINSKFDFKHFKNVNEGKIRNIFKWFIGTSSSISEGEKLMNTTDNIIVKLTKYASSLIELHGNMTNRKEEYKHLCKLFDKLENIEEAHKYSSVIFGIENVRHFIGYSNINTDQIINTYDIPPIEILLSSRTKLRKEKVHIEPIVDKSIEKRKILEEYRIEQERNKQILKNLIKDKCIILDGELTLSKIERRYIQKLLSSPNKKETEFGLSYNVVKNNSKCKIISEDGIFIMDSMKIEFEGDI